MTRSAQVLERWRAHAGLTSEDFYAHGYRDALEDVKVLADNGLDTGIPANSIVALVIKYAHDHGHRK